MDRSVCSSCTLTSLASKYFDTISLFFADRAQACRNTNDCAANIQRKNAQTSHKNKSSCIY